MFINTLQRLETQTLGHYCYYLILTACNLVNECVSAEATVLVRPDIPEIVRFVAVPPEIRLGDCSVLQWETRGASRVFVTNLTSGSAPVNVNTSDQLVVCPQRTTTYSLTVTNDRGEIVSSDVTIVVRPNLSIITQFTAAPPEIRLGETTDLCWTMENVAQASITNTPSGTVQLTGNDLVSGCITGISPQGTTTYTLTASNDGGEIVTASVTVPVRPALPRIVEFTATPSEIRSGESSLLTWATENADTLTLTNSNGGILPTSGANGSLSVTPVETTTYTLTATNGAGESVSAAVTVVVKPSIPVITRFTASLVDPSDNVINPGDPVLLEWETNADQHPSLVVNITNIGTSLAASGSTQVSPQSTTLYTLTVSNGAGEVVTANVIVEVVLQPPTILRFTCAPPGVPSGGAVQISWNTSDAQTVSLTNLTTSSLIATGLPASGTLTRTMTRDTTFRLTATSAQNLVAEADCTVNVF